MARIKSLKVNSNSETCIDDINLYILFEDNKITDIHFDGEACAISTSATSAASSATGSAAGAKALIDKLIFLSSSLKSTILAVITSPMLNTSAGFST